MTHEIKKIFEAFANAKKKGIKAVLATVVALDGSSYRKPGVCMLILDDDHMIGAVSGGCVEKEILRQSQEVFKSGQSKMMTYDGRYRLGCEGILYILLEPFHPNNELTESFYRCLQNRHFFKMISYYERKDGMLPGIGSLLKFSEEEIFPVDEENNSLSRNNSSPMATFSQTKSPCFQLIIIGTEHDAVQLCLFAFSTGWDVTIIASPKDPRNITDFPGAKCVLSIDHTELSQMTFDDQTAIVVMTHNFAADLCFLTALKNTHTLYIGLLGPVLRREKLLSQLIEFDHTISSEYLDKIHGPAGLNIGSVTPQEIAIAIVAEILAVIRNQIPLKLSEKSQNIHIK